MNAIRTFATAGRVLRQLGHDPRSIALMLIAPSLLVGLFAWLFSEQHGVFDQFGGAILALFPFVIMFLITSITTLRERRSGTLERLMTTPLGKADFIPGYGIAFGLMASLQAVDHGDLRGVRLRARGRGPDLATRSRRRGRRHPRHGAGTAWRAHSRTPSSKPCSSCP